MSNSFDLQKVKDTPEHPVLKSIVEYLCKKTGTYSPDFFKIQTISFLGIMAASMRTEIHSKERGIIPANIYGINLAPSGFGKGYATNILEDLIEGFKDEFTTGTLPDISEINITDRSIKNAAISGLSESEERSKLLAMYKSCGADVFMFDSGTAPAVKQLYAKYILSGIGSINFHVDEIGSNLSSNMELMSLFLELYDLGRIKQKITKNTYDNIRLQDLNGRVPANLLMFGTTAKLMDGSKNEEEFFKLLEEGYARRCFFGFESTRINNEIITDPVDIYNSIIADQRTNNEIDRLKNRFKDLADQSNYRRKLVVPKETAIELIAYRQLCEKKANEFREHDHIKSAEMSHRFFKSLKLAGVFAFIDKKNEITKKYLYQAIKVAEDGERSFNNILRRERNFIRLAKYITESDEEFTHADLVEELPYYPSYATARNEMMNLASAWSLKNYRLIHREVVQDIEIFKGEKLEKTSLDKLVFSISRDWSKGYKKQERGFHNLVNLLKAPGYNWCNHAFLDEHRKEDNVIEGFNLVVIDVDGGISIKSCMELLKDYRFILGTTKRHTEEENRFRIIFPIEYVLKLNKESYKKFIDNFMLFLPFSSDSSANQRSKKWLTNPDSEVYINDGEHTRFIDVARFIHNTRFNQSYLEEVSRTKMSRNLERWFLNHITPGNRNNKLYQYAMVLVDSGYSFNDIKVKVRQLNKASRYPLEDTEITNTILNTIKQKCKG